MELCFATNNINKLKEVTALLGSNFSLLSLKEIGCTQELPEDFDTIEKNSCQKAEYIYKNYQVNCFADDSGLEVFALDNEPGVKSAHYAGRQRSDSDNIELLLKNIARASNKAAQFKTVITLFLDGAIHQFVGTAKGEIIQEKRGSQGFGYDPIFVPEGYKKTFAEMTMDEKNEISHRGKAIKKLVAFLKERFENANG